MEGAPAVTFCPVKPLQPFTPCDPAELAPLLNQLGKPGPATESVTFPRGTLLADGRVDVCKQQIGPGGAAAVAAALRDNPHVTAVLRGADGIGDAGAAAVADLIAANPAVRTT